MVTELRKLVKVKINFKIGYNFIIKLILVIIKIDYDVQWRVGGRRGSVRDVGR